MSSQTLRLVLDTNVILDWLVFADPSVECLSSAVEHGRIILIANAQALDELTRVLAYPKLKLPAPSREEIVSRYRATADLFDEGAAPVQLPPSFPRCSDTDDDHFIALAYRAQADALVSKDKGVLKLRKRARRFDIQIVDLREMSALLTT